MDPLPTRDPKLRAILRLLSEAWNGSWYAVPMSVSPSKPAVAHHVRKRCKNCGKIFMSYRAWQEFCSPECRRQFWDNNNTGFGRVRVELEKRLKRVTAELRAITERLAELDKRIDRLYDDPAVRRAIAASISSTPS